MRPTHLPSLTVLTWDLASFCLHSLPVFPDGEGAPFDSKTSSGAWTSVLKELRANDPSSRKFVAVSGPVMFGFSDKHVLQLLCQLPGVEHCFKFQAPAP
jgi:F/Y rich C-terminus